MSKHAVVAGGSGFIGSHLVDLLLQQNYQVTVLDNFVTGRSANLSHVAKDIRLVQIDINEFEDIPGHVDEIYNLASPASPVDFKRMPTFILNTAAIGHQNLLACAAKKGARILFASTSEVYGDPLVHPQNESYFGNVNPIGMRGCYDEAKRFGEALTMAYHRFHNVDTRIARIFNTYGERMRPDDGRIIPNFFMQALQKQQLTVYGDGKQTRSFCYVKDLCEGIFKLMQSSETKPVNIGNPLERAVREMADEINDLTGNSQPLKFLPLPENDPLQRKPDIAKAKEVLGWEPKTTLEDGLELCLEYFEDELKVAGAIHTPTMS